MDKNEGSIAIRNRLKVAQTKAASADADLKFDPKFWHLPQKSLHALLYVLAESDGGQKELESLKIAELQAILVILLAYARKDCDVPAPLQKSSGKGLRESLREAVVVSVTKAGADGGFARYSHIRNVIPKKK